MSIVICNICGKQHKGNFETCTSCITKEQQMSIEIGQKYIGKNGEVVEVEDIFDYKTYEAIWFFSKGKRRVLTKYEFLEQYKPYEEQKQTVTIEKWLCRNNGYFIAQGDKEYLESIYPLSKVKLLDTYEVTL